MATEKNPQAAEILTGHQLPSALLGNLKYHSISAICQSSAEKEEYSSSESDEYYDEDGSSSEIGTNTGDEDDFSSFGEVSSSSSEDDAKDKEVKDDSSEEDDAPPAPKIPYPRRSRALKMLSDDYRKLLEEKLMLPISEEDAEKCLGKKRFKFVDETHPIPESFFIVDSMGFLIIIWLTQGPGDEWLVDEQTRVRLKFLAGPVRNQEKHFICWAYVDCDLISAARVLNGLDKEFVPLSPMFLCRNVWPEKYRENCEASKKKHCCFGMYLITGLVYSKLHGVPKERPEEVKFDCKISEEFKVGEEELYKVKEIYYYDTLESALQRLKSGHPIGAVLLLFSGWHKYHKVETDDEMTIYEGPKPGKAFKSEHAVIIIDFRIIRGIKVAICKLSNGKGVANGGYMAVSLEIMVSMVGASKKFQSLYCDNKPQYLLRDFHSVDVEMGLEPLIAVEPNEAEANEKFKVDIDMIPHKLLAPSYRSPAPTSTCLNMNAANKQFKVVQSEYEMTVDESSVAEEARDRNLVPTDNNKNPEHFLTTNPF